MNPAMKWFAIWLIVAVIAVVVFAGTRYETDNDVEGRGK